MADLLPLALIPSNGPNPRRRGRPPGARNKRSLDLAKYVEATMAGMTPGQQMVHLALVTPAEIRRAKAEALELGIPDRGLSALQLAMVVKAEKLAQALGIKRPDAYAILHRERVELMAYVHQRQPTAPEPGKAGQLPTAFMIPAEGQTLPLLELAADDGDGLEFIDVSPTPPAPVGQGQSDD